MNQKGPFSLERVVLSHKLLMFCDVFMYNFDLSISPPQFGCHSLPRRIVSLKFACSVFVPSCCLVFMN